MKSSNMAILRGHLGSDPEVRQFPNSSDVSVRLRLATNAHWKTRDGEAKTRTDWHSIDVYGSAADYARRYLKCGSHVAITGSIRYDVVEKPGEPKRVYTVIRASEVTGLDPRREAPPGYSPPRAQSSAPTRAQPPPPQTDGLPF